MKYLINKITRKILKLQDAESLIDDSLFEIATVDVIDDYELKESKANKLKLLDDYQKNNPEVRELTINNYFKFSLSAEGRSMISEQILQLQNKIELGSITEEDAFFEYFYVGGSIQVSFLQLKQIYTKMIDIINTNYGVYKDHTFNISNLTSVESIKSYNFKNNYLKNQNINF